METNAREPLGWTETTSGFPGSPTVATTAFVVVETTDTEAPEEFVTQRNDPPGCTSAHSGAGSPATVAATCFVAVSITVRLLPFLFTTYAYEPPFPIATYCAPSPAGI